MVLRAVLSLVWAAHRAAASAVLKDWADKARAPAVLRARATWAAAQAWVLRAKASKVATPDVAAAPVQVTPEQAAILVDPAAVKVACNALGNCF